MVEPTTTQLLITHLPLALPFVAFGFLLGILGNVLEQTIQFIDTVVQVVLLALVLALIGGPLGEFLHILARTTEPHQFGYFVIILVFAPMMVGDYIGGWVISGKKVRKKHLP